MLSDPLKQRFILHRTAGDTQTGLNNILVGAVHVNAVHLKECQHHIHADPLIAIHKGMVTDERETQTRALFFFGWIEFFAAECGKRTLQRTIQQCKVPDMVSTARLLNQQLMEQQHLFL